MSTYLKFFEFFETWIQMLIIIKIKTITFNIVIEYLVSLYDTGKLHLDIFRKSKVTLAQQYRVH